MANDDLAIENARQTEQIKTLFSAMDKMEKRIDGVEKIASSVERMASTMETLTENMKEMKSDIAEIKKEPASAWKNFKWIVVTVVTTGIVSVILTALFTLKK